MTPLEIMEARLTELRKQSETLYDQRGALIDTAAAEKRGATVDEFAKYDDLTTKRSAVEREIGPVAERVNELREQAKRNEVADVARAAAGEPEAHRSPATVKDPEVYAKGNGQRSFFRDAARANVLGDREAGERLVKHARAMADTPEQRALGNTNTTGGSGGELAPPLWLVADYIKLARAGRVTADLFHKSDVPMGVSSVNIPKIMTGTATAVQSTQNTALAQVDMTTGFVGTGFTTIGGKEVVSQQILDQSAINFDDLITADLAADYAIRIGTQVLLGPGTGANNNSVVNGLFNAAVPAANQITYTATGVGVTAAAFYSKCAGALSAFATNRFAQPTVWVMHPRRWYWLLAQTDSTGRPLVVPNAVAYNPMATNAVQDAVAGPVGMFLGLPVVIDPLISTTLGAGANQDRVYLLKADDLWLFESPVTAEVFREPYADSMGVLFRLYAYVGTVLNRQAFSIAYVDGSGLSAPTF